MPETFGALLGEGATSRVFGWGNSCVVKLYRRTYAYLAPIEHERANAVHAAGVPSPRVHDLVDIDGRVGVVFERIDGPSLLDELIARAVKVEDVGRVVAALHVQIQDCTVIGLPELADTLSARGIDGMPRGTTVFHGDLHPGNILRRGHEFVVIDWSNAHTAAPAADVACALLAMRYRGLRADDPRRDRLHAIRLRLASAYEASYRSMRHEVIADTPLWYRTIGALLLEQEPDTAFADELRDSFNAVNHEPVGGATPAPAGVTNPRPA